MVKGVNKKVIEVNNTGSKFIEKIVFYITPQYGDLSQKQLEKAIKAFDNEKSGTRVKGLRVRYKRKRIKKHLLIASISVFAVAAVIFLICK